MSLPASPASNFRTRQSYDFGKPDEGLAEWTNKVRSIQSQVDEDDAQEQRRLEEEITRSRLERAKRRRSTGTFGVRSGFQSGSQLPAAERVSSPTIPSRLTSPTITEHDPVIESPRQNPQGDIDFLSMSKSPNSNAESEPISLAAFMGGRATGPRLNKPAPQADTHDPTTFQHALYQGSPSLLAQVAAGQGGPANPQNRRADDDIEVSRTSPQSQKPDPIAISTLVPAISIPDAKSSSGNTVPAWKAELSRRKSFTSASPTGSRISQTSISPPGSQILRRSPSSIDKSSSPPPLARPIQPQARPSHMFVPPSENPSPAFSSSSPPKEVTPSLTRLQGRGLVSKRVQDRAQMFEKTESLSPPVSTPIPRKKSSVLARWQPAAAQAEPDPEIVKPPLRKVQTMANQSELGIVESPQSAPRASSVPPPGKLPTVGLTPSPAFTPPSGGSDLHRPIQKLNMAQNAAFIRLPGMMGPGGLPPRPSRSTAGGEQGSRAEVSQMATPFRLPGMASAAGPPPFGRGAAKEHAQKHEEEEDAPASDGTKPLNHLTKGRARGPKRRAPSAVAQNLSATPEPDADADENVSADKPSSPRRGAFSPTIPAVGEGDDASKLTLSSLSLDDAPRRSSFSGGTKPTVAAGAEKVTPKQELTQSPHQDSAIRPDDVGRPATKGSTETRPSAIDLARRMSAELDLPAQEQTKSAGRRGGDSQIQEAVFSPADIKLTQPSEPPHFEPSPSSPQNDAEALKQLRQKSISQKYSSLAMPTLEEVKTPVPSPVATLTKADMKTINVEKDLPPPPPPPPKDESPPPGRSTSVKSKSGGRKKSSSAEPAKPPAPSQDAPAKPPAEAKAPLTAAAALPPKEVIPPHEAKDSLDETIRIPHRDGPLPPLDMQLILNPPTELSSYDPNANPISVDVLLIALDGTATPISQPHIFYDSEVRAILYRAKDKHSGLVSSTVWSWQGRAAQISEKHEWKLNDLAARFGTALIRCAQGGEPDDLVDLLGGVIAIRQGTRAHWAPENTAMYCIRVIGSCVFVDQVDLDITNLSSAFSFVISVLDAVYVWHGRGSSEEEQKQARGYAEAISSDAMTVHEFEEGNEDPMFWMILGDGFASADFWKFRPELGDVRQRLYRIMSSNPLRPVQHIGQFSAQDLDHASVLVLDGLFELFVIVGKNARGKRDDIRLAITVAEKISKAVAHDRPFEPPVHVLILPSRLPVDLRTAHFRYLDEEQVNEGAVPKHLNVIPLALALEHLNKEVWQKSDLSDRTFLPLGISPEMLR